MSQLLGPVLSKIGVPPAVLPMALVRPFSGSASIAVMADTVHTYGPDALVSQMVSTILGSTETTFYIIAVYFGAVGIKRTRHAIPTGLLADLVGTAAAIAVCRWLLT